MSDPIKPIVQNPPTSPKPTVLGTPVLSSDGMEVASARLWLNRGHDVPINGLTPAELILLHVLHKDNVGGDVITDLKVTGKAEDVDPNQSDPEPILDKDGKPVMNYLNKPTFKEPPKVARTVLGEVRRLKSKYGKLVNKKGDSIISTLYPGATAPQGVPLTFAEVKLNELNYEDVQPGDKLAL